MVDFLLKSALVILVIISMQQFGGKVEGRLFPVARSFKVDKIEPAMVGFSRIWGTFFVIRTGCDFQALDWVLENKSRKTSVALLRETPSQVRGYGEQEFGPWLVQLTPFQMRENSTATSYHQCPWRPWVTETKLYP